jgi:hypothetical protein
MLPWPSFHTCQASRFILGGICAQAYEAGIGISTKPAPLNLHAPRHPGAVSGAAAAAQSAKAAQENVRLRALLQVRMHGSAA